MTRIGKEIAVMKKEEVKNVNYVIYRGKCLVYPKKDQVNR